jgi:hypothetical protein
MFRTLKLERSQKFASEMEFAGSTQNPTKIIRTSCNLIRTKIFPKKSMFSTLKVQWNQKLNRIRPRALKTIGIKLSANNLYLKRKSI